MEDNTAEKSSLSDVASIPAESLAVEVDENRIGIRGNDTNAKSKDDMRAVKAETITSGTDNKAKKEPRDMSKNAMKNESKDATKDATKIKDATKDENKIKDESNTLNSKHAESDANTKVKPIVTYQTDEDALKEAISRRETINKTNNESVKEFGEAELAGQYRCTARQRRQRRCRPAERSNPIGSHHAAIQGGLQNFANALKESRKKGTDLMKEIGRTTTSRKKRANLGHFMAEWTHTFDAPSFDFESISILILLIFGLVVCPILTMAKSRVILPLHEFTAPLEIKRGWSMAVCVASILVGLILVAYILLLPWLRSVFPIMETTHLSYSDKLLNSMHLTAGARLAYSCISQSQVLKRKSRTSRLTGRKTQRSCKFLGGRFPGKNTLRR